MNKEIKEPKNIKIEKENIDKPKRNFWQRILISVKDIELYKELAAEKVTTAIGYLMQLILILALVSTTLLIYKFNKDFQVFLGKFDQNVQELEIKEGKLEVKQEDAIKIKDLKLLEEVIIDTKVEDENKINEYIKEITNNNNAVLLLKDKVLYKTPLSDKLEESGYDVILNNLEKEKITKQDILDYFSNKNLSIIYSTAFVFILIYSFVIYLSTILLDVLILSLLGFITTKLTGLDIKYSALFNMGCYAITLSLLLNIGYVILNTLTGFEIKYFGVMYTTVSYIYMVTAIILIKSDLIKKHFELMKIKEEEEKVKEEIKRQEEEKKLEEEAEERRKRREEKKKKQEEKQKEDKTGAGEPASEGNNA